MLFMTVPNMHEQRRRDDLLRAIHRHLGLASSIDDILGVDGCGGDVIEGVE